MKPFKEKQILLTVVLTVCLCFLCHAPTRAARRTYLSIAAGQATGACFAMAGAIARVARHELKDENIRVSAESTDGQAANARLVDSGEYDLGIIQNVIMAEAIAGAGPIFEAPLPNLKAACALGAQVIHLIAHPEAGIAGVADLKGKRVGVGAVGSATSFNCRHVLNAWGLEFEDLAKALQGRDSLALDYVKDGRLDAAFFTLGQTEPLLMSVSNKTPLALVPLQGPPVVKLMAGHRGYHKHIIPAKAYPDLRADVPTLSATTLLAARANLAQNLVYNLLATVFSNLTQLGRYYSGLALLSLEKGVPDREAPLHQGAEKFFKEKGLLK